MNELNELKELIKLNEHILDCLNVRLFYIQNKNYKNEQEDNENKLKIIKTYYQIEQQQKKINKLTQDFNMNFQILNY